MPSSVIALAVYYIAIELGATAVVAMAITMVASAVATRAFNNQNQPDVGGGSSSSPDPGNRQQVPPATNNKLPVVYGTAWVGGTIIDLSISEDNQQLYYVLALSEVTNTNSGQTPDNFTFGDIYYGGKKVVFQENGYTVAKLIDESTGVQDTTVNGRIQFYLYRNGSNSPVNSTKTAIEVLEASGLIYKWDSTKLMSNCAFAILHLSYSQSANIRGIQQTQFQITNPRTNTGDCIYDYLINTRYGAALPTNQIDTASLNALTAYSNEVITFNPYSGGTETQARFKFNGVVNTSRVIMDNLQDMSSCCDCLVKYNEITGKWGVIVNKPTYTVAMDINDSNMISSIQITPIDLAGSYNVIEAKFVENTNQDAFNTVTLDLAELDPALLLPNEPVNKVSLNLPYVNNNVQAQIIANRILKAAREDLQVQVSVNYVGIQLEAGDIVTVTNANYGWAAKPFRINKVVDQFNEDGSIVCQLTLMEFNSQIYDDTSITQFNPSPNTGIGDPTFFGQVLAPNIVAQYPDAATPSFSLSVTTSAAGIIQYAEVWYSAYPNPLQEQMYFAGTSEVQSNGNPWLPGNFQLPLVNIAGIPAGNWYFFSRMVNSLASSAYSPHSELLEWRPTTFQYTERYIVVAYADDINGGGFSFNPRNKTYYGLLNLPSGNPSTNPANYSWYLAPQPFGALTTDNFLLYCNRSNRKFSFNVGNAAYIGISGAFVPTETSIYDPTLWSGLEDGNNVIDLDMRTGQVTKIGTSSVSSADGLVSVTNNTRGTMVVSLQKFLNFGNGVYSKNFNPASLTIDVFGRVVGFSQEDDFYYSDDIFTATSGQTSFAVTHIIGEVLVFRNGLLMPLSEYTETTSTIVLNNPCVAGEIIQIINMRAVSLSDNYIPDNITVGSLGNAIAWKNNSNATVVWTNSSSSTIGWLSSFTYVGLPYQPLQVGDQITFSNVGTPTVYTITAVNPVTKSIVFNTVLTGVSVGDQFYEFRASGTTYQPFYRTTVYADNLSSYSPNEYYLRSGFEQIYVNGAQFNEIDYDLTDNLLSGFPASITGEMDIILFAPNNLGVPCSNITNTVAYSINGAISYSFPNNPLAMQVYANGTLFVKGSGYDYIPNTNGYNLNTAIPNNYTLLNQQTFSRIGAA